jgi:hypothetical protein
MASPGRGRVGRAGQFGFDRGELRVGREVVPLVRVAVVVVQLLATVGVANVPPALAADGVIVAVVGRHRRRLPLRLGIGEQRADVRALDVPRLRHAAERAEGRVNAHQVYGPVADTAGRRHAGGDPDVWHPCRLLPEGELTPVLLLAEVPAVVAPKDDDGVRLGGGSVVGVQQPANLRVAVGNRRQVRLDRVLPPARLQHGRVVAVWLGQLDAGRWHVVEIVGCVRRQHNRVEREEVVILLRNVPGHVRLVQADRQEEGLCVPRGELLDAVVDGRLVG